MAKLGARAPEVKTLRGATIAPGKRTSMVEELTMKVAKILVPLDGSPRAEAALPKAVDLLRVNDAARLVLVHAVDPATVPGLAFTDAHVAAINAGADYLRRVAEQLRNEGVGGREICPVRRRRSSHRGGRANGETECHRDGQ